MFAYPGLKTNTTRTEFCRILKSSLVFCPRAALSLQTQASRLQFCSKAGIPPQIPEPRLQFYKG